MLTTSSTRSNIAALNFVVDKESLVRGTGGQIDWDLVVGKYKRGAFKVVVGTGGIAKGATSLPVTALEQKLFAGDILDFGQVSSVTVTVSASALQGATSISVNALSGPIPSGTVLDMGGAKFARTTADAAAGATSITVAALPTALAGGETATYVGGDKALRVAANAEVGATTVTVEKAQFAVAADAVAYPTGGLTNLKQGAKFIPQGTVMAQLSSGKLIPRDLVTGAETAFCILETDAASDSNTDSLTGYGTLLSGYFYENLLPDADDSGVISSTYKTELRNRGGSWMFRQWVDSRGQ